VVGRWTKIRRVHRRTLGFSTRTRGDIGFLVVLTEDFTEISEPFFRACEIKATHMWLWDESEGRSAQRDEYNTRSDARTTHERAGRE